MSAKNAFIALISFVGGIAFVFCACIALTIGMIGSLGSSLNNLGDLDTNTASNSDNKILVVNIKGTILNEGEEDPFGFLDSGVTYGYNIQRELIDAADDPQVKAIIIDVDSPGGTVTGSNAISEGIDYFKEKTGKPVIGFGSGLIASGGYWAIVPSDEIIVDLGSVVGSIGVISGQLTYYNGLVAEGDFLGGNVTTKNGIEREYITAGKGKDLGSPYRRITAEERKLLQDQADTTYDVFVKHVVNNREDLTEKIVREELGAYIFNTQLALEKKMIDRIGSRQDAIDAALAAAEITGDDYDLVSIPDSDADFFNELFGVLRIVNGTQQATDAKLYAKTCAATSQVMAYHGSLAALCQ